MTFGAYAVLDQEALRHNFSKVRDFAPAAKVMAVIKANGYGHGAVSVANALAGADAFAVARIDEAIALRKAGCMHPITVLEGFSTTKGLEALLHYQLDTVIHCFIQLDILKSRPEQAQLAVWLKIDTGMNRLGFRVDDFISVYHQLRQCSVVKQPIGLMTHLACADDKQDEATRQQIHLFNTVTQGYEGVRSIANSAGLMVWPASLADWVRPGVMLYGISPFLGQVGKDLGLRPVMNLYSHLIAVKPVKKGEVVGYGGSWRCEKNITLGVVAVGYGDGYPRHTRVGTPVLVNGKRVPLVGRVSMDMITVDLTSQPEAKVGDPVTLWGKDLPVEVIADCANTIPYTLVCGVTQRVSWLQDSL